MSTSEGAAGTPDGSDPDSIKACCSAAYSNDLVATLLGDSYHPGGASLTRRLARTLGIGPGSRVLDIAAGPGSSALLLAEDFGADVLGIDISPELVDRARTAGRGAEGVEFIVADAELLPLATGGFDAVFCECALSTFPDKSSALAEFARVLRPGGRLGLTDVTLDVDRLGDDLRSLAGYVACLGGALTVDGYRELMAGAGFRVIHEQEHNRSLARMIESIEARLKALSILGLAQSAGVSVDPNRVLELTAAAAGCVAQGIAGYHLFAAERR